MSAASGLASGVERLFGNGLGCQALVCLVGLSAGGCATAADSTGASVASVVVAPTSASIVVGATVQLSATVWDAAGNTLTGRAVSWSSSHDAVATVDSSGLATGIAMGLAVITATSEGQSGSATVTVTADPPPPSGEGALTFAAANPRWLVYEDGTPFFMVASGGPEGFLFDGSKQADGTRAGGRQQAIIDAAIAHGWNGIYLMATRTTDGAPEDHPWLDYADPGGADKWNADIIAQWHGWLQQMDEAGIVIYFILYDDGEDPFGGASMGGAEEAFVTDLVNEFKLYKHLIWCIAEEYSEALPADRARQLAAAIRSHDPIHPVANHQLTGTTFDFPTEPNFHQFAMQLQQGTDPNIDPDGIHADVVTAWLSAEGRYNLNASELQPDHGYPGKETLTRQTTWAAIMGGAYVMVLRWWDNERADGNPSPTTLEQQQAGYAQAFMAATRFDFMEPADARASGDTEWVLAHRAALGNDYFVGYGRNVSGGLGFTAMDPGTYLLRWLDTETGAEAAETITLSTAGTHTFPPPAPLGGELVLYAELLP